MKTMNMIRNVAAILTMVAFSGLFALGQTAAAEPNPVYATVSVRSLPTPARLMKDAEEDGLSIVRIDQSPDRVVASYKYPTGVVRVFVYTVINQVSAAVPAGPTYGAANSPAVPAAVQVVDNSIWIDGYWAIYPQGNVWVPGHWETRAPSAGTRPPALVYAGPAAAIYNQPANPDYLTPLIVGATFGWAFGGHGCLDGYRACDGWFRHGNWHRH